MNARSRNECVIDHVHFYRCRTDIQSISIKSDLPIFSINRYRFLSIDYSGFKNSIRCIQRRPQGPFSKGGRERILGTRLVCIIITCVNNASKTFQFHVSRVSNSAESLWLQKGMSISYFSCMAGWFSRSCLLRKTIKNCTEKLYKVTVSFERSSLRKHK